MDDNDVILSEANQVMDDNDVILSEAKNLLLRMISFVLHTWKGVL